jgi:multisubunit Na+/H+ antiporter MnhG subunit
MVEAIVLVVTVLAARVLAAPLLRRLRSPAWFERLRARGRPGMPLVATLGALVLMVGLWLIGEQRGLLNLLLLLLWIAAPLTAWEVLRAWRRRRSS